MSKKDKWLDDYDAKWKAKADSNLNWWGKGGAAQTGGLVTPRCYTTHKEIELSGGVILGASCGSPRKGYDIYVGLDAYSMHYQARRYPWETEPVEGQPEYEFLFPIIDGSIPASNGPFGQMVDWLVGQLAEGKRIHIGCIGGHGRTGLLIAAVAARVGIDDAIAWTRKVHCSKAIETESQIEFLVKHYNVKSAEATKVFTKVGGNVHFASGGKLVGVHQIPALKNSSLGIW